jgi:hypothetical protein
MEAAMSKTFVNRFTLVSVLSGALLAVHMVLPVHAGHTTVIPVTASQQFDAGSPRAMTITQSVISRQQQTQTHG